MNILVIGNGFDLAHGLPTKYTNFLEVVVSFRNLINNQAIMRNGYLECTAKPKYAFLDKFIFNETILCDEFNKLVVNNIWIEYFLRNPLYQKENWIDFESEISEVIQSLDKDMHRLSGVNSIEEEKFDLSNKFFNEKLNKKYMEYTYAAHSINAMEDGNLQKENIFKKIRDDLLDDLNRLIRALEIYLCEYVGKIEIKVKSPDIEKLKVDKVLSFNYTDTFSKLYKVAVDDTDSFDYIHGKADINNKINTNNMVLGIDEYLPDDRKNKDIEFIAFKKFYQRIHKQTGCKYKEWADKIRQDYLNYLQKNETAKSDTTQRISAIKHEKCQVHNLYIFGHSLDITDGDILRDLILNDNLKTTIFYHNKDVMGQQIVNLVKVIGQDELKKRTEGNTKTIEFKRQQDIVAVI